MIKPNLTTKIIVLVVALVFSVPVFGQNMGDYRTNATGTWNWNIVTNWQRCVAAGTWAGATSTTYPGQNAGTGAVTIQNNTIVTLNISPVNSLSSLIISTGGNNSGVTISGNNSLSVTGATTINGSGSNNTDKYITVAAGSFSSGSLDMTDGGANSRDCFISVSTGSVTISGSITMPATNQRNYLLFTGTGTINIGGTVTGGGITSTAGGGAGAPTSGTVNYNNAGAQNIGSYSYYNLTVSGSGTKSLAGPAIVGGTYTNNFSGITLDCGANDLTFNGTVTNTGILSNGTNTVTYGGTGSQSVIATNYNNLTTSGARTVNNLTFSGTTGIAGIFTPGATFTGGSNVVTGTTIDFNGDAAQNIPAFTYYNLNVSNKNASSAISQTKTQTGIITLNGDLNIYGTATSIITLQLGNFNFSVNGNSNINDYGNLTDAGASTNLFAGPVVISANGRWNVPQPCTFRNGLTVNSASFTSGSTYTFNTNNQNIDGTASITLAAVVTGTAGLTLTNANTSGLTITGLLSGVGNFTNGTGSNNAILYLSGTPDPLTLTGATDFSTNLNTVNFNGNAAQTISARNFYNLTISGSRATNNITLANGGAIRISGAFAPVATFSTGNYVTTNNTIEFNGSGAQILPALGTASYNNITLSGGSTKTLVGNITLGASGVLNLNGGIAELADFNLTVSNNAAGAFVPGAAFSSSNMISTGGIGYLQKNGNAAASFQIVYPVGSGGYYSPMTISAIGTITPVYMRVRAVPVAINPSYITKYWDVTANAGLNNVTATFQYNAAEANGASSSISYSNNGGSTWQNPPAAGTSSFGANSFTITGTNPFNGWWTMGYRTYYSYQTGDWNTASTWTSDPSGTLQLGNTIPGVNDLVVILSGRTVSLTSNIASTTIDLTINGGGYLDMSTFSFTSGLQALRGQGTMQLASAGFPTAATNTFVNAGGGTTEYKANINLPLSQTIYNNLKINASGAVIQLNNLTLNGNLEVVRGNFQINDNTLARRQLIINGNVTVSNGAQITVGTGVTNTATSNPIGISTTLGAPFIDYYDSYSHRVVIMGDFSNNGTVRFTNLTFPVYNSFPPTVIGATTGFATVYFRGSTNNTLTCNGITDFYNLVVDKGTDQSFGLTIRSSDYANFRLFGANIAGGDVTPPATASDPNLKKALWIRSGTLTLEGSVVIPSLSEGNDGSAAALNFIIPSSASLKLNGIDVIVQSTADLYEEVNAAYGVAGGSGTVNGVTGAPNESGLLVLGKLEVNNGFLSCKESRGILYSPTIAGQIFINGGTVDAKQFRSATAGSGLVGYTQTGGIFNLRGRFQRIPAAYTSATDLSAAPISNVRLNDAALLATAGSFSIENTSDIFTMTGGAINIYDVPATGGISRAWDILTSSANFNVTGGTISLLPASGTGGSADATPWLVSGASPVGNMIINRAGGASTIQLNTGYPLTVLNNLSLQSGVLAANDLDVTVGGDFSIFAGTTYTTGTNTTIFNGPGVQTVSIDLAGPLSLNNLKIDKTAGVALNLAGTQGTLNVAGTFSLYNGTFNDNGKIVNIAGNVYNSGIHTGSGKLSLNGTNIQSIDGNGSGVFNNVELNNTNASASPVSLINNAAINGTLTLSQNKLFNISTYNLLLNSSASIVGAGALRYIKTAGALGDGGLTKVFSSASTFIFPVGVTNYTPGSIGINGVPTAWGSITVVPVNYAHPNVTAAGRSLSYFWRVKSAGFTLGPATVTHGYTYNDANVVTGAGITEDGYVAASYNPVAYTWSRGSVTDVDETNNIIGEPGAGTFLENTSFIDGDFTAGDDNPTNPFGTPSIYYSRQSGAWGTAANWSLTSHTVTNPPASPPGANDIVIIGNGNTISFGTPANYLINPNTDPHSCASLQIASGSTLDIRFNPASTFSMVQSHPGGNGTIRIAAGFNSGSTFAFPSGDFSDFNQNLGTTELYSTNSGSGTTYWLPNGIGSYGNLIISPLGGSNIIFPNNNLTVLGDLIMRGQNADSWFCPTWNGDYPTAPATRISKTITVIGDFDIQGGSFGWYGGGGGGSQNIVVNGDVIVAPGAGIDVWGTNASQSMSIGGSLINNSTNVIAGGTTTLSYVNLTLVPVTFFGSTDASITNTTGNPRTDFGSVTVNKGTSPATTLTLNIGNILNTPVNNWLTLQNGTLRYMRTNPTAGAHFNISQTNPFSIPSTAGLYIDYSNANNVNILIGNAANNNGDLLLSGKLTIVRGNVYVGPTNSPDNHNDIEYSGSGASEIDMQGGNLYVNGNIRRAGTSGGILKYSQSGSSNVTVNGRGTLVTNAKLEILNSGSSFNMSGTSTLTIVRGGGTSSYGDLYLRPESASVTGGTIYLQPVTGITGAEETFKVDANVGLYNLIITGFAAADAARVQLTVNPLVLSGNLTLSNANSFLATNNLDVSIGGNFTNSGTYTYGTNTTLFNGNTQSILGATITNFNNLTVSPLTSLTVNNNFNVSGNLLITRGILILANRKLTLVGNLTNNGTYTDDNIAGGISLAGTSLQQIAGTGSFGRLEINNNSGAKLNNDISIQNNLVLTLGKLDINANLLTLGLNSSVGGSPFSLNNMIVSDGVTSSRGVRKFFNIIAAPQNFVFPVGESGKYTPATLTINANGAVGYINVNPVNNNHPAVVDPNNVLDYYWQIESSGITNFNGSLALKYLSSDVRGTESDYIAARLLVPGTSWSKATPGPLTDNVDESTQTISFTMPAGTNNLNGDYTAGTDIAIPDDVPAYSSIMDGDWSDQTIWMPIGSSPPCPVGGPNGFIVIINNQVTTDIDHCFAYITTINNKLFIQSGTFGHNLGLIDGGGSLVMENGNLPAGNFTSFLNCTSGGTLEYGGTGNYTIIASQFSTVPNLFFTGSGTRILPNKDLTICNSMVIDGPLLDNTANNSKLIIKGTLERYNTGAFSSGTGLNATISFQGTAPQNFGGVTGSFSGTNQLNNLEINNNTGLTIGNGSIEIKGNLLLTSGIITTTAANRLIITNTLAACVIPAGGSASSFINGPLTKSILAGNSFIYPIGTGSVLGHIFTVTAGGGPTAQWTAEYLSPNSTAFSYSNPLEAVNTDEYWSLSSSFAKTGYVKMAWDNNSAITPLMTQNGISDMRVATYNAGNWQSLQTTTTGNNNVGDVATTNTVNINTTSKNFTIASISATTARASFAPTGPVCGSAGIPVQFDSFSSIPLNYTLTYSVNGTGQPVVNITSLPYILPTPSPGAYILTGFTYNNGLTTGVVDNQTINVYAVPTVADAGTDQSLCGVSGTVLAGNNPAPYSGLWSIVSGAGGTLVNSTQFNTAFTGVLGETYRLQWTISNASCFSTDEVVISFPVVASRPSNFTSAPTPVCQGSAGLVYTVPNVAGNTYNWTYSGTGQTISGSGNSVTINFSSSATSGTLSVTATNSCGTSSPRNVDITVNPIPVATFSYPGSPYCLHTANPLPAFSGGGVAGVFSSTPGLVFVSTATGQVDLTTSTPGIYTVSNTIAASGGCGIVIATSQIEITSHLYWTGTLNSDWNTAGNWSCGYVPDINTTVQISDVPNNPILTSGSTGTINNIIIDLGASLTVTGNTLQISGSITNNGTFDATDGRIELNGSVAQTLGPGVFAGNTIKDLIVNNSAGVTLSAPLAISGIVAAQNGNLLSAGNLTLLSTAGQTSLIDGSGSGNITGNVTMQRYLPSGFGYKYFSSPFQSATVGEFSDDMTLGAYTFYRYDESRTASGWLNYNNPANILNPLAGYAVNFGSNSASRTVDITGPVNNGNLSVTLFNHNNLYTQGFNLVGNPYPSPIDWDAVKLNNILIDDAVYYFKASTTDQYGGTYNTYINTVSSDGIVNNIIPSMQGFFVHVSNGSFPVSGTLSMTNSVRLTNLNQPFSKKNLLSVPLLRLTAQYSDDTSSVDPLAIYFDDTATPDFDSQLDALKLFNTDLNIPNLYSVTPDGTKLSICALPLITDNFCRVPLGLKLNRERNGTIIFRILNIDESLARMRIYLTDTIAGIEQDLLPDKEYRIALDKGEYLNRFFLNLSASPTGIKPDINELSGLFSIYSLHGLVKAEINELIGNEGRLILYNLTGQVMFIKEVFDTGYLEFNPSLKDGIYIASYMTGTKRSSKKLPIQNR